MVFGGTAVIHGVGIVTAAGMPTETGRIAGMVSEETDQATPLQRERVRVGRLLGCVVIRMALVMVVMTTLLVEDDHGVSALFDVLIVGIALAVGAVCRRGALARFLPRELPIR